MKPRDLFILSGVLYAVSGSITLWQLTQGTEDNTSTATHAAALIGALGGVTSGIGLFLQFRGKLV